MGARVPVPDEFLRARIKVLLGALDALAEGRRSRGIQDPDPRARPRGHIDPEQPGVLVGSAWADGPDLTRRQRVRADLVLALQLRGRDELFDALGPKVIAEVRIAELGRANALLLLL